MIPKSKIMKAYLTVLCMLAFGAFSFAQDSKIDNNSVEEVKKPLIAKIKAPILPVNSNPLQKNLVRLYKTKNSRIKNELAFFVKVNDSKMV